MGLILGDLEKAGTAAFEKLSRKLDAVDEQAIKDIITDGRAAVKKLNTLADLLTTELAAVKAIRERLFHP